MDTHDPVCDDSDITVTGRSGENEAGENDTGDGAVPASRTPRQRRRRTVWRRIRRTCYVLLGLFVGVPLLAFLVGYLIWDVRDPHDVLDDLDRTVVLRYSDGSDLTRIVPADGDRRFVPFGEVPRKLRAAIVAVEDPTFWDNEGFDPKAIARAAVTGVGGGSGITQQYVKKSTGDDEHSYLRKFKELVLATKITQEQSKQEIFESYVNIISFGRNTYGPAAAVKAYFGKPLKRGLTWSEAAFLAGTIQSPSVHDPAVSGHRHAQQRWKYAADKLHERGYVNGQQRAAMSYPNNAVVDPAEAAAGRVTYSEHHVKQRVLAELEANGYPLDRLRKRGMRVETTIERAAQEAGERVVRARLDGERDYLRAALVSIEPSTGGVIAYQGGPWNLRDYADTPRAAGSAFHPFVTVAGLEHGSSIWRSYPAPPEAEFGGEVYRNRNSCTGAGESSARCSVREALRSSVDTPFVEMTKRFGTGAVSDAAHDTGIPERIVGKPALREPDGMSIGPRIAVGGYRVRPFDMAASYATFANGGMRVQPHFVRRVLDAQGNVVWEQTPEPVAAFENGKRPDDAGTASGSPAVPGDGAGGSATTGPPVAGPESARPIPEDGGGIPRGPWVASQVTEALREVGGSSAAELAGERSAAAKAGAYRFKDTADNSAAWMVGYTPQVSTAVWTGADGPRRLRDAGNEKITGRTVPADIWQSFMRTYHRGRPSRSFPWQQHPMAAPVPGTPDTPPGERSRPHPRSTARPR